MEASVKICMASVEHDRAVCCTASATQSTAETLRPQCLPSVGGILTLLFLVFESLLGSLITSHRFGASRLFDIYQYVIYTGIFLLEAATCRETRA